MRDFRHTLSNVKSLRSIPEHEKRTIRIPLKKCIYISYKKDYSSVIFFGFSFPILIFVSFVVGAVVFRYVIPGVGLQSEEITNYMESVAGAHAAHATIRKIVNGAIWAIALAPVLCFFYISKLEKVGVSAAVYTALWATFGSAGFIWYKADGNLLGSFLARVGIIAVIFTVATAVSNYLGNVTYSLVRRLYDKKYPDMALGMCLLDLVYQLEKPKAVWQDLEVRTYSLNLLGKAAFLVRKHLF